MLLSQAPSEDRLPAVPDVVAVRGKRAACRIYTSVTTGIEASLAHRRSLLAVSGAHGVPAGGARQVRLKPLYFLVGATRKAPTPEKRWVFGGPRAWKGGGCSRGRKVVTFKLNFN